MFHQSTTLHHSYSQSFSPAGTSRLTNVSWTTEKLMKARTMMEPWRPVGRFAKWYGKWAIGYPLWEKPAKAGLKGLDKLLYAGETSIHAAKEIGAGLLKIFPLSPAIFAGSRLTRIWRYFRHVSVASLSAAIRTPMAVIKSPFGLIKGVRESIQNIPSSAKDIFNQVRQLKVWDTVLSTRDALANTLFPIPEHTVGPILAPAAEVGKQAFKAEWATPEAIQKIRHETWPEAINQIRNSVRTGMSITDANRAGRDAEREKNKKLKEARRKKMHDLVAAETHGLTSEEMEKATQ